MLVRNVLAPFCLGEDLNGMTNRHVVQLRTYYCEDDITKLITSPCAYRVFHGAQQPATYM